MTDTQAIREALYPSPKSSKREERAARTRAKALSPTRILMLFASLPVVAAGTALGIYIRTSPYEPVPALQHIVALAGCEAAQAVGVAPAQIGEPGYHPRYDPDQNGVACEPAPPTQKKESGFFGLGKDKPAERSGIGSAKFVRPE